MSAFLRCPAKFVGYFHMMCQVILTVVIGANVCVVGTPSRLTHVYQPVGLTFVHLLFTYVFQRMGLTNADGHNYVYKNLDWNNKVFLNVYVFTSETSMTLSKQYDDVNTLPGYGKTTSRLSGQWTHGSGPVDTVFIDCRRDDPMTIHQDYDHRWMDRQYLCTMLRGCLSAEPVASPPYAMLTYDPHQSYREVADSASRRSPGEEVSASKAKSWQEVQRGSADVPGEAGRVLHPRTALTHFYIGATSECLAKHQQPGVDCTGQPFPVRAASLTSQVRGRLTFF
ncbi:hypothetical protein Btru_006286 [Bulinus truncatus]|nr:hypothetical protein Btru_006286 [Bulinus truncatus]